MSVGPALPFVRRGPWCLMSRCSRNLIACLTFFCSRNAGGEGVGFVLREGDETVLDRSDLAGQFGGVRADLSHTLATCQCWGVGLGQELIAFRLPPRTFIWATSVTTFVEAFVIPF